MTSIEQLWDKVQSSAFVQFIDHDYRRLLFAVVLLLLLWLVHVPLARLLSYWPRRVMQRTGVLDAAQARTLFDGPVRLAVLGLAIFAFAVYAVLEGQHLDFAQRLAQTLLAVAFFRLLHGGLPLVRAEWQGLERAFGGELVDWLAKGLRVSIVLVATATLLQLWGIQVMPIVAGAGLFGVAVALGAQTFFKNLIGGMLILAGKRFYKGEWIKVPGVVEGTVESIGFHSTVVRKFDKAPVTLPNTMLSDAAVINYSRRPHRRISWAISLLYQTTVPQLAQIRDQIERYILESDDFVSPPDVPVLVRVDKFSESSIDMMIYCFTQTHDWDEWLKIKENLAFEILRIIEEAGSALAYPSQTLFLQHGEAESPHTEDIPKSLF